MRSRALVFVDIAEDGVPYAATVQGCPSVFHRAAREGILAWRWDPPLVDGRPSKARTSIGITFRMAESRSPGSCARP